MFMSEEEEEDTKASRVYGKFESKELSRHNKYGNMKMCVDSPVFIGLGPDYWCFLPTFTVFTIISFLLTRLVLYNTSNIYFQLATIIICGGMCVSYLAVATSNPGIVTQEDYTDSDMEEDRPLGSEKSMPRKRLCRVCNIRVKKGTYHCSDCDVCVQGYDHHCPWTSKCIGSGNMIRFYIFLGFVPVYLIYIFVAFAAVMSTLTVHHSRKHVRGGI